ncbi:hypothetical protein [Saccharopolyspora flava]|uniref:Uncharacterized protein n=1 Tax=Saccharopolyspora flava TaxID=95161 RepID=A0A1I6V7G4_9PSEU|nr:hypothetical protein [Saccharopolyspora flava]SFT09611.1 hypothetical protein SAMN05660874_05677 [Saccharopolyspora flava]
MQFSEKYGIQRGPEDDWLDVNLAVDTNLSVDPFLIWESGDDPFWGKAHDDLIAFFGMVFDLVRASKGNQNSPEWGRAAQLLTFPEPPEFCLGVSEGSILGIGSAGKLRAEMMDGLNTAFEAGLSQVVHMEAISLFQGGIGLDRIGDTVCNVLKSYFIEYTKNICARHGIPTQKQLVRNASWTLEGQRWLNQWHDLPINNFEYIRKGEVRSAELHVLLVPQRFVRNIPIATPNGHWKWAWANMGEELRRDFNWEIASKVLRKTKAKMARLHPSSVVEYLNELEEEPKEPYPVGEDPKLLVHIDEHGKKAVENLTDPVVPRTPSDFEEFVDAVVYWYKHGIENQDDWYLLWDDKRGRAEHAAQVMFRMIASNYCRVANVDITGEANAGRGPVDFKFSQGWSARALIEVKLARSTKLLDGVLSQLPAYQTAEGVNYGIFLVIAYTDEEYNDTVKDKLEKAADLASRTYGFRIKSVLVDARRKESASKEHDPELTKELRDKLNGL